MSKVAIVTGADRTIRTGPDRHRTFTAAADHAPPVRGCAAKWGSARAADRQRTPPQLGGGWRLNLVARAPGA
jgi:hypothetical protein